MTEKGVATGAVVDSMKIVTFPSTERTKHLLCHKPATSVCRGLRAREASRREEDRGCILAALKGLRRDSSNVPFSNPWNRRQLCRER